MILVDFLILAVFAYDALQARRRVFSFESMTRFFMSFVLGVGLVILTHSAPYQGLVLAENQLVTLKFYYVLFYASFVAGSFFLRAVMPSHQASVRFTDSATIEKSLLFLAVISVSVLILFILDKGINVGDASYVKRYENAVGSGILIVFFSAFLPFLLYQLIQSKSALRFLIVAAIGVAFSLLIFASFNGYRQLTIACLLLITLAGIHKGLIRPNAKLALIFFAIIGLTLAMAFLRYQEDAAQSPVSTNSRIASYILGDFFANDAALRIHTHCQYHDCPGMRPFLNHFKRIIPRFAWPEKPEIIEDSAGYYTRQIRQYGRNVTLSATILGEGILIGAPIAIIAIAALSGALAVILDKTIAHSRGLWAYVCLSHIYLTFFWIREGLEVILYRLIILSAFFIIALAVAWLVGSMTEGRRVGLPISRRSDQAPR